MAGRGNDKTHRHQSQFQLFSILVLLCLWDPNDSLAGLIHQTNTPQNQTVDPANPVFPWVFEIPNVFESPSAFVFWGCFIDCEEVVRISDGTSYFDDETIPQGPDVADWLLEILDAG
jgi:hypothetical protein